MCEFHLPMCTQQATDVHHMDGRTGDKLLDVSRWKAGCRSCHSWVELNPQAAKDLGFSGNRL